MSGPLTLPPGPVEGQALALYEMKVVLATLFSSLRVERPNGAVSRLRVVERRRLRT
jgi:cytochrome P450